jgi:hypothetical protein
VDAEINQIHTLPSREGWLRVGGREPNYLLGKRHVNRSFQHRMLRLVTRCSHKGTVANIIKEMITFA